MRRRLLAIMTGVVAGIAWSGAPRGVGASVAGDSGAIVVGSGTLSNITVASSPSGVQMQPASFSTSTHDYALRSCAGDSLTFTLQGSSLQVGSQSGSQVSVTEDVVAGQAIIVQTGSAQYWFRCLPNDFPPITVSTHGTTTPGWYVTATIINSNASPGSTTGLYDMILDSNGTPVWYTPETGVDFQLLTDSTLSWGPLTGPGDGADPNAPFTLYRYDEQTSTSLLPAPTPHWSSPRPPMDPHELLHLSNGDYMMLASPVTSGDKVTFTDATGTTHSNVNIVDCVIEELNPSGKLVWSWDAYYGAHISPSETFLGGNAISASGSPYNGAFDVYHCNSLDVDPTVSNPSNADVLLSARNTDAVYRIRRSGGTVLWKLGNDHAPSGSQLTAARTTGADHEPLLSTSWLTAENTIGGQHDARFQSGSSAVSFYDDHTGQPTTTDGARGVQLKVSGTTAAETYDFPAPDSSAAGNATGSYRPNGAAGDNVVGWGFRNALAMTEFNNSGTDLRDIYFNTSASATGGGYFAYRFVKLPESAFNAQLLRQTSGTPRSSLAPVGAGWNHPGEQTLQSQQAAAGVITGAGTSPASPGKGWIDVFWKGADKGLWHAWTLDDGGRFTGPVSLGGGPLNGSPRAVSPAAGDIDVFWRGGDDGLWYDYFVDGKGWSGPRSLGGAKTMAGDAFPVAFGSGEIDVFWKGAAGNLWVDGYNGHAWSGATSLGSGPLGSDPHPVSAASGSVSVFWEGTDRNLWERGYTSSTGWQPLRSLGSGPLNSDPEPVSPASGVLDVFWRGTENGLWYGTQSASGSWSGGKRILGSGVVTSTPHPVSSATGYVDVFWRTTDPHSGASSLDETRFVPGSGWKLAAAPSSTSLLTDPSPISAAAGHVAVLAESLDGTFWFQTTSGSGSPPG